MNNINKDLNAKSWSTPNSPISGRPRPHNTINEYLNQNRCPPSPLVNGRKTDKTNGSVLKQNSNDIKSGTPTPLGTPILSAVKLAGSAPPSPSLSIKRPAFNVTEFNTTFLPIETHKTTKEKIKRFKPDFSRKAWIKRIQTVFPILVWLPKYDIKTNLIIDIIVGITIASFQVPQSMGYALIANVNPIFGLYTAFFPALLYTILGTSRHSAVGPVAIVSGLMTGNIVIDVMEELGLPNERKDSAGLTGPFNITRVPAGYEDITNIDIANMVALINGIYIFVFGCLRLGFISNYLSEELVSGFMTSCAIYVFTTQLHYLTGIHLTNRTGMFALIKTYIEFFEKITEANLTDIVISIICMAILLVFKFFIEKILHKYNIKMPFPIYAVIIIGGIIFSNVLKLEETYHIQVVGDIPNHFQNPWVPKLKLFGYMWARCIPTALIAYTVSMSVGRIYGAKHNYKVDSNQEMIAIGAANLWASIWGCIPSAASIPRSYVQESGGGRTQVVSIVNCVCIAIVITALSTLLHALPSCVLAACIAVALATIISKFQELGKFWKLSKLDGGIWIVTFFSVVILNVDYGLYLGFGASLLLLIYKSQRPKTYSLGTIGSDIYVPLSRYQRAKEVEGIKIYQFCGPLNFANCEYFKEELQTRSGVDLTTIKEELSKVETRTCCYHLDDTEEKELKQTEIKAKYNLPTHIIIDCSMLSYIDSGGVKTIKQLIANHADIGIQVLLSGCHVHIETSLKKEAFFEAVSSDQVYTSVHDAIAFISDVKEKQSIADSFDDDIAVNISGK